MTTWSLLNVTLADDVEKLLSNKALREDSQDLVRAMSRDQASAVIHAALWAYSCRSDSFAACYAMDALYHALGLETWTFKPATAPETEGDAK